MSGSLAWIVESHAHYPAKEFLILRRLEVGMVQKTYLALINNKIVIVSAKKCSRNLQNDFFEVL